MKSQLNLLPLALLLLISCASTSSSSRIDNALLSELPPASMSAIVEARASKDTASDALAKAERDTQWAEEQGDLTRSNLIVARAELADAKLAMVTPESSGTLSQLEVAKRSYEYAVARADEVR